MKTQTISKQDLINQIAPVSRPTFLKWVKELTNEKGCPFTYEQFKRGHFVRSKHAQFILENL